MDSTMITIILLITLILISVVYGLSLNKKIQKLQVPTSPREEELHVEGSKIFAEMDMKTIEAFALAQMKDATEKSAAKLQSSLTNIAEKVASELSDIATKNLDQEFEKYRVHLESLRSKSIAQFDTLQKSLNDHYVEQVTKIDTTLTAEASKQIDALYARIDDVVSGYIIDSLGATVDLGTQSSVIIAELEKHKDDIKREIV